MANGNDSLAAAWGNFDDPTKLRLTVTELDRLHLRINRLHSDLENDIMHAQDDFRERIADSRRDFNNWFQRVEATMEDHSREMDKFKDEVRSSFKTQNTWLLTLLGGVITALIVLAVQFASQ